MRFFTISIVVVFLATSCKSVPFNYQERQDSIPNVHVIETIDTRNHAKVLVYFDSASTKAARESAGTILKTIAATSNLLNIDPSKVKWHDVQFTNTQDTFLQLASQGKGIWRVPTDSSGNITPFGHTMLESVLPHEQVHAYQNSFFYRDGLAKLDLPLWFIEGQATWAGFRTGLELPELSLETQKAKHSYETKLLAARNEINLESFYRGRPKPEAIRRQLSGSQLIEYDRSGNIPDNVAFQFKEGELEQSDHQEAHYLAAALVFEKIERIAGLDALHRWFNAVAAEPAGSVTSSRLIQLALETTGVDINSDIHGKISK